MNDQLNIYQEAIESLLVEGYAILQIVQPNGSTLYFNVFTFQEGYFNTAQSIDFNTVEGINITNFLVKNAAMCRNSKEFIHHFVEENDKLPVIRLQFSKESIWYYWSTPILKKK